MTSKKVNYCYDLLDAAYDAKQIWEQGKALGHVAIIDRNPCKGKVIPMSPHEAKRYNERGSCERFNGRFQLKGVSRVPCECEEESCLRISSASVCLSLFHKSILSLR